MNIINHLTNNLSRIEMISISINIIMFIVFFTLYKIGKFSNEFVEARTIENAKFHYRIETYKTKFNEWLYRVIDKDKDKTIKTSKKFSSKLNLDRDILRTYENADEVIGIPEAKKQRPIGVQSSNELHEEIIAP